jgi:hypothetical protein
LCPLPRAVAGAVLGLLRPCSMVTGGSWLVVMRHDCRAQASDHLRRINSWAGRGTPLPSPSWRPPPHLIPRPGGGIFAGVTASATATRPRRPRSEIRGRRGQRRAVHSSVQGRSFATRQSDGRGLYGLLDTEEDRCSRSKLKKLSTRETRAPNETGDATVNGDSSRPNGRLQSVR